MKKWWCFHFGRQPQETHSMPEWQRVQQSGDLNERMCDATRCTRREVRSLLLPLWRHRGVDRNWWFSSCFERAFNIRLSPISPVSREVRKKKGIDSRFGHLMRALRCLGNTGKTGALPPDEIVLAPGRVTQLKPLSARSQRNAAAGGRNEAGVMRGGEKGAGKKKEVGWRVPEMIRGPAVDHDGRGYKRGNAAGGTR